MYVIHVLQTTNKSKTKQLSDFLTALFDIQTPFTILTDLNLENYRQKANYKKKQPRLKLDNLVSDAMV